MKKKYDQIETRYYNSLDPQFIFPEDKIEYLQQKENLGITFSGGGTRSASLSMGQLRALNELGVLKRVRFLSGVSGGSWATVPYTFLDQAIPDKQFLGTYTPPDQITKESLRQVPDNSLTYAIVNSKILDRIPKDIELDHDLYSHIIADIFLEPFNLNSHYKFFTYNTDSLQLILSKNTELTADDFYMVNPGDNRPYYFAGGTLLRPHHNRYQFEMSPLYLGINQLFKDAGDFHLYDLGGGYVEPHGFDSDAPDQADGQYARVILGNEKNIFSLGDIVGVSGAAPAEYAKELGLYWLGFPKYKYWCHFDDPTATKEKEYDFGDGGILENLGIMPLLKRKVEKIIVFVNGSTPLEISSIENQSDGTVQIDAKISDSIPALFMSIPNQYGEHNFDKNVVFANQTDKYNQLLIDLNDKISNGHAPIHINTYQVTEQPHYNITKDDEYQVKIMWIYNAPVVDWKKKLPNDVFAFLDNDPMFKHFPYYNTFLENPPEIIELKPEQANMAAHLSSWIIASNRELFDTF